MAVYVEGAKEKSQLSFQNLTGAFPPESLCSFPLNPAPNGIYVVHFDLEELTCVRADGPLSVDASCASQRGPVQLSSISPNASEWFATTCLRGDCEGSRQGLGLFHHREHETHAWLVAHSDSTITFTISALALINADQAVRRINLGINYVFNASVPSPSVSVLANPKESSPFVQVTENTFKRGTLLLLATLTGPYAESVLETGAIRRLAVDGYFSISTLHAIPGSQDPLVSGLVDSGNVSQAFVGIASPAGLSAVFRQPAIVSKAGDGGSHVVAILSCQLVGHNAFLTFAAHDAKWTFGELTPSLGSREDVLDVFTVKLHLESSIMIDTKFLWQAADLPTVEGDAVRTGRAIFFPSVSPFGIVVASVESDAVGIKQTLFTHAALPSWTFPAIHKESDSGHRMGNASPVAAWSFVVVCLAMTAGVGYIAWRYWKNNGAAEWQKMKEEELRRGSGSGF